MASIFHMVVIVCSIVGKYYYKVDRCLARYNPRAEANNAIPTTIHQQGTKGAGKAYMCSRKHILGQIWPFLDRNPNFLEREQKYWCSHIRKPTRQPVLIVFWSGLAPKCARKANIWPKMTTNANFWPKSLFLREDAKLLVSSYRGTY